MTPIPVKTSTVGMWIVSTLVSILIILVGVVYSNVTKELDKKASIDIVLEMKEDVKDIKAMQNIFLQLHLKVGDEDINLMLENEKEKEKKNIGKFNK